jgi:hypothetical protein
MLSLLLSSVLAQTTKITLPNPLNSQQTSGILDPSKPGILWITIGRAVLMLVAIAAVVMILYGGFTWLTARGEKDKITTARDTILWVILGLVVVSGAYVFLKFVIQALQGAFMK